MTARFGVTTNALDRLTQAEGLLGDLRTARFQPNRFRHLATAFVASLRSTLFMLNADYGTRAGFADWWSVGYHALRPEPAWALLKKWRDKSLKDGVLTHTDYGTVDDALQIFEEQLRLMKEVVDYCMTRWEGRG
jgi:hypothetical protein